MVPALETPLSLRHLSAAESEAMLWQLPDWALLLLVAGGIGLLLLLVVLVKLPAFVALLLVSVAVGVAAGIAPTELPALLEEGMGGTLGEIAIIVALGAMLGRMLRESGAARLLSRRLLDAFGDNRAPLAVGLTALLVGVPVFFDVGFVLLIPLLYSVAERTGRSLISIVLPAVGGLAIMHAVLPPHPGPVAAAGLLGASLGWVAVMGLVCGLPAWFLGSYLFGIAVGDRNFTPVPNITSTMDENAESDESAKTEADRVSLGITIAVILCPVLLILLHTFASVVLPEGPVRASAEFIGHPVIALIVTVLLSFWALGLRGGFSMGAVERAASASLGPVALVLLVTGAGGVFGEVLESTGAGAALADLLGVTALPLVVLAFLIATVLRAALGSKTVAIVTTAPIVAPMVQQMGLSQPEIALIVIAIASGGTVLSHVNDSGFWLFNRYLDIDIKTTLKTWTMMETVMGGIAFLIAAVLSFVLAAV